MIKKSTTIILCILYHWRKGTNTYHVQIEYADGTVVQSGLDTTTVDGVGYQMNSGPRPECFAEIISKSSLES